MLLATPLHWLRDDVICYFDVDVAIRVGGHVQSHRGGTRDCWRKTARMPKVGK